MIVHTYLYKYRRVIYVARCGIGKTSCYIQFSKKTWSCISFVSNKLRSVFTKNFLGMGQR